MNQTGVASTGCRRIAAINRCRPDISAGAGRVAAVGTLTVAYTGTASEAAASDWSMASAVVATQVKIGTSDSV